MKLTAWEREILQDVEAQHRAWAKDQQQQRQAWERHFFNVLDPAGQFRAEVFRRLEHMEANEQARMLR